MSNDGAARQQRVLYYVPGSCALGSIISLAWSRLPHRLERMTAEQTKSGDYLAINALGQVPALVVDGTVITESAAILNHVGGATRPSLLPKEGSSERDRFNRVLAFLTSSFHPSFGPLFHPERFARGDSAQEDVRTFALGTIRARYAQIERWLSSGEEALEPTPGRLASAYLFGVARWGFDHFDVAGEFPLVAAFQQAMLREPAVQCALAIEAGTGASGP